MTFSGYPGFHKSKAICCLQKQVPLGSCKCTAEAAASPLPQEVACEDTLDHTVRSTCFSHCAHDHLSAFDAVTSLLLVHAHAWAQAFTAEQESPLLLQHEFHLVQTAPAAPDMDNFSLKANSITREVIAGDGHQTAIQQPLEES